MHSNMSLSFIMKMIHTLINLKIFVRNDAKFLVCIEIRFCWSRLFQ